MTSLHRPAITIKDIAQVLGMAHTTVSRALNDHPKINADTKIRVKEMAARLGYVANLGARSMRIGWSRLVGLIVPDVQNEFYSGAARAMAERCAQAGYQMMLGVSEDDPEREEQHLRMLRENRAAGVLIAPSVGPTKQSIDFLLHMPTVQFLRCTREIGNLRVLADDFDGTYKATEHLLALGHRRIGFLGVALTLSTGLQRSAGYEAALRNRNVAADPTLQRIGPPRPEFGDAAFESLLATAGDISAVVVGSSRQLLGVMRAARRAGMLVPQHLSIVSYGDADWFQVSDPPITAIALPVRDMSERATQLLFQILARTPVKTREHEPLFPTKIIVRGSTAKPKSPTTIA